MTGEEKILDLPAEAGKVGIIMIGARTQARAAQEAILPGDPRCETHLAHHVLLHEVGHFQTISVPNLKSIDRLATVRTMGSNGG